MPAENRFTGQYLLRAGNTKYGDFLDTVAAISTLGRNCTKRIGKCIRLEHVYLQCSVPLLTLNVLQGNSIFIDLYLCHSVSRKNKQLCKFIKVFARFFHFSLKFPLYVQSDARHLACVLGVYKMHVRSFITAYNVFNDLIQ